MNLLAPEVVTSFSEEERAALTALAGPGGQIELRNFAYEIVEISDTTAEVVYSGERCAPTVRNEFPETSAILGPDDFVERTSGGSVVDGPVECSDIAKVFERIPPVKFTKSGDNWYGTLAGLS